MMHFRVNQGVFLTIAGVAAFLALPAQAELQFGEGDWRLELSGMKVLEEKDTEQYASLAAEYEFPACARGKLGLRMYPLFLLHDPQAIYGVGAGVTGRVYQRAKTYDGLFGEVGLSALWHSSDFPGNGSRVNFVSEAGIGYKFREAPWHVTVKFEHISNAGLAPRNSGINAVGLALGCTF